MPHQRLFNFKKADFGSFRDVLSSIPWDCCFLDGDVEEAWTKFKDLFFIAADQCIPSFTLKRKITKSWLSDEVLTLIRRKRRAYRIAKRSGNSNHQRRYKSLCNKVRNLTRRDHYLHVDMITKDLHRDPKPFWHWLKYIRGSHHTIPDIHY